MLFNSIEFAIFLPIVFILHWLVLKRTTTRNTFLLFASYFFYGSWDWRFTILLLFSTGLDYFTGIRISETQSTTRKVWLWTSIIINLGFLSVFKYYNFFVDSIQHVVPGAYSTLKIILPVGISFYTFHGLSYVIDIYYKRTKPEYNFVTYALFVSFFPLLVAGPIERATHLLPQLKTTRTFSYENGVLGLRQILWGLFKKIVIADNCALLVNDVFGHTDSYPASTLVIAAILFAFQIYGDFSGYSDIALGTARLFGIELLKNFAYPYFSRDMAEFWRRWHISLSSWFKDYVYIPLGGSRGSMTRSVVNTIIIFAVSGLWHGANWTFVIWGLLNALFVLPSILLKQNRNNLTIVAEGRSWPTFNEILKMGSTFLLTVFAWIFFRSETWSAAIQFLSAILSPSLLSVPTGMNFSVLVFTMLTILGMLLLEWRGRSHAFAISDGLFKRKTWRYSFYSVLAIMILLFYGSNQEFIYFQF